MLYTEKDYPALREDFLNNFINKTYKRESVYETPTRHGFYGEPIPQPRERKRFLAEENYHGKYQPGSIVEYTEPWRAMKVLVIGRYYTVNLGHWKHYRVKTLVLTGENKGRIKFFTAG